MIVLRFKRGVVLLSWRLFFLCCGLPTRQWKVSLAGLSWCTCMSVLFSFGSCALGIFSCEAVNPRKGFRGRVEHLNYLTEQSCSLMAKVHNLTSANKEHTRKSVLINDFCASERVMNFDPFYTRQSLTSKSPFLKSRIILFSKKKLLWLLGYPGNNTSKCALCILMYIMHMSGIWKLVAVSPWKNVTWLQN